MYTQVSFDGHHQTATDSVVPASAPATAAASSVGNGTALTTFSAVRGAGSDGGGGRGEYVQVSYRNIHIKTIPTSHLYPE